MFERLQRAPVLRRPERPLDLPLRLDDLPRATRTSEPTLGVVAEPGAAPLRPRSTGSLDIDVRIERTAVLATVIGRFDAHGVPRFVDEVLDRIDGSTPNVHIDLGRVEFMDSSAVAALVRALRTTLHHGGSLSLIDISTPVRIILELTRLDQIFPQGPTPGSGALVGSTRSAGRGRP